MQFFQPTSILAVLGACLVFMIFAAAEKAVNTLQDIYAWFTEGPLSFLTSIFI